MIENLVYKRKNGFLDTDKETKEIIFDFCEDYRLALNEGKTEREFCKLSEKLLIEAGFENICNKSQLKPGDRVYSVNRGKGIATFVIGTEPIETGVNMVAAHIDSPRLDLKPLPLYEDGGFAFLKTHYYGGIKKYHWYNIPLALHGVIVKGDGSVIDVTIGEDSGAPIFCITDLLPHLSGKYNSKSVSEAFEAEKLNVNVGNIPFDEKEADGIKYGILALLNEKYGIVEKDFMRSELELVPAFEARDMGFDRSMIAGYGQDDRASAYPALRAVMDIKNPRKTAVCILIDKEEVGSVGNTSMQSKYLENILAKVCSLCGVANSDLILRECLENSKALSADVAAGYDPNFAEVFDKNNTAEINKGLTIMKCVGSGAKSGANDTNAEFVGELLGLFDDAGVLYQSGEYGKVDLCCAGTISKFIANLGMEVVDCGVPLLAMHSPGEVVGKFDVYMAYKGFKAFMNS